MQDRDIVKEGMTELNKKIYIYSHSKRLRESLCCWNNWENYNTI